MTRTSATNSTTIVVNAPARNPKRSVTNTIIAKEKKNIYMRLYYYPNDDDDRIYIQTHNKSIITSKLTKPPPAPPSPDIKPSAIG